jgi:hypothetical protein
MVLLNRSTDRYSRGSNFLWLSSLVQPNYRLLDSSDQFRNLARRQLMVSDILAHDHRREIQVAFVGVHDGHSKEVRRLYVMDQEWIKMT